MILFIYDDDDDDDDYIITIINIIITIIIIIIVVVIIIIFQIGKRQLYFIWLNHIFFDLNKLLKDTAFIFTFTPFSSVKLTANKNF